jgi:hypothetical protein
MFDEMTATRVDIDGRPYWEWPDGRTAPVISGGAFVEPDAGDAGDAGAAGFADALDGAGGDAGDAGDAGAGGAGAGAGDAGAGAAGAAGPQMVPYDVYQRQIRENQQYRERWQPLERAFDGLDDDIRGGFAELAELYKTDPAEAQRRLAEGFGLELPGQEQPQYATPADVESAIGNFFAQRDQMQHDAQQTEEARGELRETAKGLGFDPAESERDYRLLLDVASTEFGQDEWGQPRDVLDALKLAGEAIKADRKTQQDAWAREYLAGKTGGVTNVASGEAPGTEQLPQDLAGAKAALSSFLDGGG